MNLVGKTVKIFLKNGMTVEGLMQEQAEDRFIIKSPQSKNLLIVFKPEENILMVHVILDEPKTIDGVPKNPDPEDLKLDHYESDMTLRAKKLAELRQEQLRQHKQDVARHLTTWKTGGAIIQEGYYGQPSFTQHGSLNGAGEEGSGSSATNLERLPRMHRKTSKTR